MISGSIFLAIYLTLARAAQRASDTRPALRIERVYP